jgi:hypothetical protein
MRRVKGEHHRRNQKYTKTYWPYLPIVLILGGAGLANQYLPSAVGTSYSTRAGEVFGSNSSLLLDVLYLVLGALIIWYVARHFKRVKALAVSGEHILARHYLLDVVVALIIGGLYVLVR